MVRPLWAVVGALVLLLGWLALVGYGAAWDPAATVQSLSDSAVRCRLPGIAARGYLLATEWRRAQLQARGPAREDAASQRLVQEIIALRLAAARTLLEAGYPAAAEQVALAAARADYNDVSARALLLETRLEGTQAQAARRELMLLVLAGEHPRVLYALGKALSRSPDTQEAEGYLRAAQRLDPQFVPAYLLLARLALARQDRATALQWLALAGQVALTRGDREAVLRVRAEADPRFRAQVALLRLWWEAHWGSVIALSAYLLFLLTPAWLAPVWRRLRSTRAM